MSPEESASFIVAIAMLSWGKLTQDSQDNLIKAREVLKGELKKKVEEEKKE